MSRQKKLKFVIISVIFIFAGAYIWHRYLAEKYSISGRLDDREAREISGMTASVLNKDVYYVHNDSGDTSRFFAITPQGKLLSTVYYNWSDTLTRNAHDCEDIASGPGPVTGKNYIYIGDIGDNFSNRKYITVYRIMEHTRFATKKETQARAIALNLKYPDGPKDAETLMVDPQDKLLYIVTKRRDSVTVYSTPLKFKPDDTVILTKHCRLFFAGIKPFKWITSGSISHDGKRILLKSYQKVYYWNRELDEPVWKAMQHPPHELPYQQEKLGEAIAFSPDGSSYYTTSEGVFSPVYLYHSPGFFGM